MESKHFSLLIKNDTSDHGGSLKNPQLRRRPLSVSKSVHIVLRSSKATGDYSFKRHKLEIDTILQRFAKKYKIKILSFEIVGYDIHLYIKLFRRSFYPPFIRAISSAIMIKVTGFSRWNKKPEGFVFWDARPFSRVIES